MKKYLALDLGGTFLKAAVIDENTKIIEKWKVSSKSKSKEEVLNLIFEAVDKQVENVDAICISFPGVVDRNRAYCLTSGAFGNLFTELALGDILKEKYGLPVAIDNDAKCAINAELWNGALKDVKNGVAYIIGTGIGGGIAINHEVYRGSNFSAGELSGLIENLSGGFANENYYGHSIATPHILRTYKQKANLDHEVTGEEFFAKVNEGDKVAYEIFDTFCDRTAHYFYNIQCILDVEKICVGGGISAQPILLETLNRKLDAIYEESFELKNRPELVRCFYESDANLIGAVKNFLDLNQ